MDIQVNDNAENISDISVVKQSLSVGDIIAKTYDDEKHYFVIGSIDEDADDKIVFVTKIDLVKDCLFEDDDATGWDIFPTSDLIEAVMNKGDLWFPASEYKLQITSK